MAALNFDKSINPLYLYEAVQDQIKAGFMSSSPKLTLLADFLVKSAQVELQKSLSSSKKSKIFVPHKYSFEQIDFHSDLLSSKEFLHFVRLVTGLKLSKSRVSVSKFDHGAYSLLHDDLDSSERIIFFYILGSKSWKPEFGGQTILTYGDERDPIVFEPKDNSLAIVRVPKGMRNFVKYIKHFAGKNEFVKFEGVLN